MSTSTHPNTSLRSLIDTSRVLRGRAVLQADAKARDESGNDQAGNMMSGVEERMKELQIKHAKSAERAEKLKNALKRLQDASQGRKGGVDLLSESSIGRITAEALDAVGDFLGAKHLDLDLSDMRLDGKSRTLNFTVWVNSIQAWSHNHHNERVFGIGSLATVLWNLAYPKGGLIPLTSLVLELWWLALLALDPNKAKDPQFDHVVFRVVSDEPEEIVQDYSCHPAFLRLFRVRPFLIGHLRVRFLQGFYDPALPSNPEHTDVNENAFFASQTDFLVTQLPTSVRSGIFELEHPTPFLFRDVEFRCEDWGKKGKEGPWRWTMPWIEPQEEEETGHAVPVQRCFRNRCTHLGIGLLRCGKCKVAVYCGAFCQRQDWKRHKQFCSNDGSLPADLEQCHVFKALSGEAGDEDLDDDDIDPAMIKPRASPASYFLDGTLVFYPDASGHECADWFDRFFALHFENGVKKVQLDEVRGPAPQFRGDDDGEPSIEHFLDYENYPMEYPDEADDERREAEESRFEWDMHVRRSMRGAGPRREIRMLPLPSASGHWLAFKSLDELERLSALASGRSGGV